MPRILSRAEAKQVANRWNASEAATSHNSTEDERPRRPHLFFGREVDAAERQRVHDAAVDVVCLSAPAGRPANSARSDAKRSVGRLLDWFDTISGGTYQDRWLAVDADNRPQAWCPEMDAGPVRRQGARSALNALIILGVLRPSQEWLFGNKQVRFWRAWTLVNDPACWDRYFAAAEREKAPSRTTWATAQHLIRISIATGTALPDLTPSLVLAHRDYLRDTNRSTGALVAAWHFARKSGLWPGQPDNFDALVLATQKTPTELVDRYQVKSVRVRRLFIDYISEIAVSQDYGSLVGTTQILVGLFWRAIEEANPGIDTIALTKDQAAAWKKSVRTKPDGTSRRQVDGVYSSVRSFYLDIASWAHEDPATWAEWAVPCPVGVADVRGGAKRRREATHRMQARTRALTPHLDSLAVQAAHRYQQAVALRDMTYATPTGESFELHGLNYFRKPTSHGTQKTGYITEEGRSARVDTDWRVTTCFLTWAAVEVMRHTGVRVEELMELTHLSIRQYRKPDGSIIPLLQIAPSKSDQERIVPCSPELTGVLARLVEHVSVDGSVPLCIRRDPHERTFSAPMPFLFQVREAGRSRGLSHGAIRRWLVDLANSLGLRDVDGTALHFTPHDFRRIFITDLVGNGFPIHLAARLVGHSNIEVTGGYTAVYQQELFEAYDAHIRERRRLRPSEEYREPTQQEWSEFVEHFGQRKIALGDCHRPYGSDCVHEHACVRCDFLQVDPAQASRLDDIRENLQHQIKEAEQNLWLGDVDQLRLTIEHADRKREQLRVLMTREAPALVLATEGNAG